MIRTPRASLSAVLVPTLISVVGVALAAAPADAQRRPTRDAPSKEQPRKAAPKKAEPTPQEYATSLRRAGRSAAQTTVALTRRYRQKSDAVASTLLRAGYEPGPVGRALVERMKATPASAARDLESAGVRDPRELYGALLQMTRTRPDALKIVKERKGSRVAIDVFERGDGGDPPSPEEAAAEMDAAGFTPIEIADWLMRGLHELSADEVLALFLDLGITDPNQASFYEWLRGQGLSARDAAAAAAGAGVDDVASVLAAAGYAWDEIADALKWTGEKSADALAAVLAAGAPVEDAVAWAWKTGKMTASQIAETLHEAGHDAEAIAAALIANGIDALAVALALDGIGEKIEDIVRAISDYASAEEIAGILAEMQVSLAKQVEILTTVMGLSHDAAMSIIGNL